LKERLLCRLFAGANSVDLVEGLACLSVGQDFGGDPERQVYARQADEWLDGGEE